MKPPNEYQALITCLGVAHALVESVKDRCRDNAYLYRADNSLSQSARQIENCKSMLELAIGGIRDD